MQKIFSEKPQVHRTNSHEYEEVKEFNMDTIKKTNAAGVNTDLQTISKKIEGM